MGRSRSLAVPNHDAATVRWRRIPRGTRAGGREATDGTGGGALPAWSGRRVERRGRKRGGGPGNKRSKRCWSRRGRPRRWGPLAVGMGKVPEHPRMQHNGGLPAKCSISCGSCWSRKSVPLFAKCRCAVGCSGRRRRSYPARI
jgi:hypothetical protein